MFRFADKGIVFWPVQLRQVDEAGEMEVATIHLAYRLLTRDELRDRERNSLKSIVERLGGPDAPRTAEDLITILDATIEREASSVEMLLDRVSDWRGVADGDEPVEFSRERLASLLEYDVYFKPIVAGLYEASREGPAKNSQPGPGGSPAPAQA